MGSVFPDAGAGSEQEGALALDAVRSLVGGALDRAEESIRELRAVCGERFVVEAEILEAWLLRARGRYGAAALRLEQASHRTLVDERLASERRSLARVA